MKLHVDNATANYRISGYGSGYVAVNDERITRSVIVTPDRLVRDWPPQSYRELSALHLELVAQQKPEIVLLGTGERQHFPSSAILAPLFESGIGIEVMHTAAACRTYNILMSEDRLVAAALLMIQD